ncbi:MAG TPA: tyrosine-type recombinase/integrase [Gemmataceae bacterium]|jgi:integrase
MPRKRKKEQIRGQYFLWLVGIRSNGVYYADGRSNKQDAGRHSLGTRDRETALQQLAQLDLFDFSGNELRLIDASRQGTKGERSKARTTKSHRDRSLPLHERFRERLGRMPRHPDGKVFHGPLGGQLKPDTVRNILIREVLEPLAGQFPAAPGEKGFKDGRLHSFRHRFCSWCANRRVPEQVSITWLGHRDSKMVRRYYHLHREESQRQMKNLGGMGMTAVHKPGEMNQE